MTQKIIFFKGKAGSGKDTCVSGVQEVEEGLNLKLAQPIKDMTKALLNHVYPNKPDYIDYLIYDKEGKEKPIKALGGKSSRQLQQFLGTEFGRNFMQEDVWLNIVKNRIDQTEKNIYVSDCRFPNEKLSKEEYPEFTMVYVLRPDLEEISHSNHPSESLISQEGCDIVLINDGSIEDIKGKAQQLL